MAMRDMIYNSPLTHVGNAAALTVSVGSALHPVAVHAGLGDLNFYELPAAIWFVLQIIEMFRLYLEKRKIARGPQGRQGPEGPAAEVSPEFVQKVSMRLDQIHDLTNSQSEELKAAIAKIEYAAGLKAGREDALTGRKDPPAPPPTPVSRAPARAS